MLDTGALSYSFNPTSPVRDSIYVSLAYITASRKHRTLHIDGGTTVYHCKALTVCPSARTSLPASPNSPLPSCTQLDDFDRWAAALKRFISIAQADAQQQQALVDSPMPLDGGGFKGGNVLAHGGQGGQLGGKEEVEKVLEALARMNQVRRIDGAVALLEMRRCADSRVRTCSAGRRHRPARARARAAGTSAAALGVADGRQRRDCGQRSRRRQQVPLSRQAVQLDFEPASAYEWPALAVVLRRFGIAKRWHKLQRDARRADFSVA